MVRIQIRILKYYKNRSPKFRLLVVFHHSFQTRVNAQQSLLIKQHKKFSQMYLSKIISRNSKGLSQQKQKQVVWRVVKKWKWKYKIQIALWYLVGVFLRLDLHKLIYKIKFIKILNLIWFLSEAKTVLKFEPMVEITSKVNM